MKKISFKKLIIIVFIGLLIWSCLSAYRLETTRLDQEKMSTYNDRHKRLEFVDRLAGYYLPFELLTFIMGLYFVYNFWYVLFNELSDGKLYKLIVFGLTSLYGMIVTIGANRVAGKGKALALLNGEILPVSLIIKAFAWVFLAGILAYGFKKSMVKDYEKEMRKVENTDYYNEWLAMTDKLSKGI